MFKLDRKLIASASVLAVAALFAIGCGGSSSATPTGSTSINGKATIDGGTIYPVVDGKTGPYAVNAAAHKGGFTYGKKPSQNEIDAWNKDVMPDGTGLPEGSGSVEEGEEIYESQCVMCHGDFGSGATGTAGGYPALTKGNAYEMQKTLTNNRMGAAVDGDGPARAFGSYWPQTSTLWWYIQSGMPHPNTKSLSNDETYALTAYILNVNEIFIDGEEVDDEYVLDREKFLKIHLPNEKGFVPNIDGPGALDDVRKFYANAKNFGGQNLNQGAVRCMKDCQKDTVKIVHVNANGGIKDFSPAMSVVRDLPADKGPFDPKAAYEASCAACHAGYLSPGASEWAGYTGKGIEAVYKNGMNGTAGGMPANGGSSLNEEEFKLVVDYLISGK
ncbi:c-type cytochrome [Sulfurimonas sp. MAG313]|nr:c-type cytochrome [Sulfurimonas sp. MAG313]MDF1879839.1 c-type cytochrome [Sulfurimonas sp. MAG313]